MGFEMKLCVYLQLFFGRSPLPNGGGCMAGDKHDIRKGVYLTLRAWLSVI